MDVFRESTIPHFLYLPPNETWRMEAISLFITLSRQCWASQQESPKWIRRRFMSELDWVGETLRGGDHLALFLSTRPPKFEFIKRIMLFNPLGTLHFYFSKFTYEVLGFIVAFWDIKHNLLLLFLTPLLTHLSSAFTLLPFSAFKSQAF